MLGAVPEDTPQFTRVDRDGRRRARHFVVHGHEPRFALELDADSDAPDGAGRGVIRRLCVPNSWAGDYGKYARLLTQAQDFFARSSAAAPARR
jgi:hypothetical protein